MNVKSAGRVLDVFELFARERQPLTLAELARALNTPLSSCFNLVRALEARGFLYGVGNRRQVYPTRKMFELARSIVGAEPWIAQLEPKLAALRDATRETIILGRRQADRAVYVLVLEGPQNIRYSANAGDLKPLHASAVGKALLSAIDPKERGAIVDRLALEPRTEATIVDRLHFGEDLALSAERGYAVTRGENVADVMAVAMPVRLGGHPYAIAVAGPMPRMTPRLDEHRRHLHRLCSETLAQVDARAA
jgi:DNA-binding IclR family transcriptional regulator